MRKESLEIYSDETNMAVIRHSGRHFLGVLIQGDSLYLLCQTADLVCERAASSLDEDTRDEMNELRNTLWTFLTHYKLVLGEHGLPVPFSEQPRK